MTKKQFRKALADLGLSTGEFAALVGLHPVTVFMWGSARRERGIQVVPPWAKLLLEAWKVIGVPTR